MYKEKPKVKFTMNETRKLFSVDDNHEYVDFIPDYKYDPHTTNHKEMTKGFYIYGPANIDIGDNHNLCFHGEYGDIDQVEYSFILDSKTMNWNKMEPTFDGELSGWEPSPLSLHYVWDPEVGDYIQKITSKLYQNDDLFMIFLRAYIMNDSRTRLESLVPILHCRINRNDISCIDNIQTVYFPLMLEEDLKKYKVCSLTMDRDGIMESVKYKENIFMKRFYYFEWKEPVPRSPRIDTYRFNSLGKICMFSKSNGCIEQQRFAKQDMEWLLEKSYSNKDFNINIEMQPLERYRLEIKIAEDAFHLKDEEMQILHDMISDYLQSAVKERSCYQKIELERY
ncbi:MAG: hypothetical protein PHC62_00870 [Candidatus Izemoplasmatales bacterium]|nr:hypothetical protein [Candidatus Izemoplasmatales bacterium]